MRAGPLGQALPCSRSHLGKALPAAEGQGPARSRQALGGPGVSAAAGAGLPWPGAGWEAEWEQTFSLLDSVGCTNLR